METIALNKSQLLDKKSYEQLFRNHYSELCSYANNFMQDLDDAEEIVQEVFVKFWENKDEINISSSVRAYLFRSVSTLFLILLYFLA